MKVLITELREDLGTCPTGVVDEDVQSPVARRDLLERRRHRARIADVDGDGVGSRSDPAGHRRQVLSAAGHQHDLGPGAGEGRGDPAAQPAGGAGDDGDLPG